MGFGLEGRGLWECEEDEPILWAKRRRERRGLRGVTVGPLGGEGGQKPTQHTGRDRPGEAGCGGAVAGGGTQEGSLRLAHHVAGG